MRHIIKMTFWIYGVYCKHFYQLKFQFWKYNSRLCRVLFPHIQDIFEDLLIFTEFKIRKWREDHSVANNTSWRYKIFTCTTMDALFCMSLQLYEGDLLSLCFVVVVFKLTTFGRNKQMQRRLILSSLSVIDE